MFRNLFEDALEVSKPMTEEEVLKKYPEWFFDSEGVRAKDYEDDVIRVTKNLTDAGGPWHRYKFNLEKLWKQLNP